MTRASPLSTKPRRALETAMEAEWPAYTGLSLAFDNEMAARFGLRKNTIANLRSTLGLVNRPRPTPEPLPTVPSTVLALPAQWLSRSERVLRECSAQTGIERSQLLGRDRHRRYAHPRQACMAALRLTDRYSYPQIGAMLGGRDHTTIIHGVAQAVDRAARCPEARDLLASLLGAAQMAMAA